MLGSWSDCAGLLRLRGPMTVAEQKRQVWVIHNYSNSHYHREIDKWSYYQRHKKWALSRKSPHTEHLQPGDLAILRIYDEGYKGTFDIASRWRPDSKLGKDLGWVRLRNIRIWDPPVSRSLVEDQIDAKAFRHTIVRSSERDLLIITSVQRAMQKLGLSPKSSEDIVILEAGIEEAIKPSLKKIGLRLMEGRKGEQFSSQAGRYDLLCEDSGGGLVVVEIKRGNATSDEVIGQCLRYIGMIKDQIAEKGQRVRGLIVTGGFDPLLTWALKGLPDRHLISVKVFRLP
jgi:Endonuclease NucS C-terminal domain